MAELRTFAGGTVPSCCGPSEQAECCEPSAKAACCGTATDGGDCGCSAGKRTEEEDTVHTRDIVREKYAAAALAADDQHAASCGCGPTGTTDAEGRQVFGSALYIGEDSAPGTEASLRT